MPVLSLSHLLRLAGDAKSLKATSSLHALLLKTALFLDADHPVELLVSYTATSGGSEKNATHALRDLLALFAANTDDPSHWNAVVSSLSRKGLTFLAARAFPAALSLGLVPDSYSLCNSLAASVDVGFVQQLHGHALRSGWLSSVFVGGALIDAYVKSGESPNHAREVFDEMPIINVVCANALLSGYFQFQRWEDGFRLVRRMGLMGPDPDGFTLSTLLRICAEVPVAILGMEVHAYSLRRLERDAFVLSSLVEMYGKFGFIEKALLVFNTSGDLRKTDVVLWTSMLNACSRNGWFGNLISMFEDMLANSIKPDGIAFVAVLSACSRVGDVAKGMEYFESMRRDHGIAPWTEHCSCVMDLLCKAGELEKAVEFASKVLCGDVSVGLWGALLNACRATGNVEIGKFAAARALEVDPSNLGIYVEMSNMYARLGRWDEIEKLREQMKWKGSRKVLGSSRLEMIGNS